MSEVISFQFSATFLTVERLKVEGSVPSSPPAFKIPDILNYGHIELGGVKILKILKTHGSRKLGLGVKGSHLWLGYFLKKLWCEHGDQVLTHENVEKVGGS